MRSILFDKLLGH